MPDDDDLPNGSVGSSTAPFEEGNPLLHSPPEQLQTSPNASTDSLDLSQQKGRPHPQRQSSLSHPRPDGIPRTTNRVRFDIGETTNGQVPEEDWVDEEDYLQTPSQEAPLLTGITPPSQSPFLSDAFQPEDHLPNARPKSGMQSAIMNMANSIIGAGRNTPRYMRDYD